MDVRLFLLKASCFKFKWFLTWWKFTISLPRKQISVSKRKIKCLKIWLDCNSLTLSPLELRCHSYFWKSKGVLKPMTEKQIKSCKVHWPCLLYNVAICTGPALTRAYLKMFPGKLHCPLHSTCPQFLWSFRELYSQEVSQEISNASPEQSKEKVNTGLLPQNTAHSSPNGTWAKYRSEHTGHASEANALKPSDGDLEEKYISFIDRGLSDRKESQGETEGGENLKQVCGETLACLTLKTKCNEDAEEAQGPSYSCSYGSPLHFGLCGPSPPLGLSLYTGHHLPSLLGRCSQPLLLVQGQTQTW